MQKSYQLHEYKERVFVIQWRKNELFIENILKIYLKNISSIFKIIKYSKNIPIIS